MDEKGEGPGEHDRVSPDGEDVQFAVGAGAAVFARHCWIDAKKPVVVSEQKNAGNERSDKHHGEDEVSEVEGFVLHVKAYTHAACQVAGTG